MELYAVYMAQGQYVHREMVVLPLQRQQFPECGDEHD